MSREDAHTRSKVIDAEIRLGQIQTAIERGVKEHCISTREWNLKTERVQELLGDLLFFRDRLLDFLDTTGRGGRA